MPTVIGVIFFCCGAYCFLFKEDNLFGLLLIASTFEAASAVNIGKRGIQPYYVVAAFIIARAVVNRLLGIRLKRVMPQGKWLLIFGAIGITSALVLPFIFAGVPIYDPKIGIDDGLFIRPPLAFGLNNIGQAGYLAWHIATAFSLLGIKFSAGKTRAAYVWCFYIEVFFVFAESLCQLAGIDFPLWLVLNNPSLSLWENSNVAYGTRVPGTFSEPSIAGAFLVLYCVGFLAQYLARRGGSIRVIVSLVASGMVASSSSLFTLSLAPFALLVRYSPFRFPWYINFSQTKRIVWILFIFVAPLAIALLFSSGYREVLTAVTVSKGESGSFINRTAADLYSLQLLLQTYGLGVGLGSNRSSSLLSTLISNVGVAGLLAFLVFYFKLFAHLPEEYTWFKWAGFALFANMCMGIADITMPLLWCPILLAIQFSLKKNNGLSVAEEQRSDVGGGILTLTLPPKISTS
jgi:hypothetical protein